MVSGNRFCPKCGARISQGTFCADCAKASLDYTPPRIEISEFDRTFRHGTWHRFTDIEELIKSRIKEALGDKHADITLEPFEFTPKKNAKVTVTADVVSKGTSYRLTARLVYRKCDYGEKRQSSYFEGILQLRNISEKLLPFIRRRLSSMEDKGVFVTKTVEQKDGIDLYLTDRSAVQQIARQIQQKYGGELKISPQLFTFDHERSKDVYRVNAFIRLPDYTVDDVVRYAKPKSPEHDRYLKITKMGRIIMGTDPCTGKLASFETGHVKGLKKIESRQSTVMVVFPAITVMDPDDYQEDEIINAKALWKRYESGQRVTIVKTDAGVMIIE